MSAKHAPSNGFWTEHMRAIFALEVAGVEYDKPVSLARSKSLIARAQRDLPSYEKKSETELLYICNKRKAFLPPNIDLSKAFLKSTLENLDDERKFERFEDLPAELRVQIYELHILDVYYDEEGKSRMKGPPVQDPVTRVSRLLRREALPLFYDLIRLPVVMERRVVDRVARLDQTTAAFFHKAPDSVISEYKTLEITIARGFEGLVGRRWDIDLPVKDEKSDLRPYGHVFNTKMASVFEAGLNFILKDMALRPQEAKLSLRAVMNFRFALMMAG